MKTDMGVLNAIPSKRLFLSIIADYDLNRSVCELVDNAFDIWTNIGGDNLLTVNINLNKDQQTICITDNAGGVQESDLDSLVAPGQTLKKPEEEIIGIFGVGTKRAVVALSQDICITTRHSKESETFRIELDDGWLQNDSWEVHYYRVDNIEKGTTIIELQKLRIKLTDESITELRKHLEATYARLLENKKTKIILNNKEIEGLKFDNWAYPPEYSPRKYSGNLRVEGDKKIKVEVTAGLGRESSPATGEYGVYVYCNNRLIARGLKSYDVGFTKGIAGLPHPSVSLVKVIVSLNGPAQFMPWNSSKSAIAPNHKVFIAVQVLLLQLVKHYASLSRRLEGDWPESVFKYHSGEILDVPSFDFPNIGDLYLPPLPKSKPRYGDLVKKANAQIGLKKPWTVGLYESIIAVDLIFKQQLEQKNRICLILLDSTLEIAFKEFLVNESGERYNDARLLQIFSNREAVKNEIKGHEGIQIDDETWKKINHYYWCRSKLVHERASVSIGDKEVNDYREIVQSILTKLFGELCF
jgi:hypothetical protein